MSSRTRLLVFLVSTPLVLFVIVGGLLGATATTPVQRGVPHLNVFKDVESLIINAYVEDVNVDKVFDGAMRGLADGLDSSSAYLTPEEVRAVETRTSAPTADTGIVLTRQFYLRIVGVRDGSPAHRLGLRTGDYVRAINGVATREMSAFAGMRLLRGAPGSKVTLLVIRVNPADPKTIEITREVPRTELASAKRLAGGEAYVRISSFQGGTAEAVRSSLNALGSGTPSSLIVDVRGTADGTAEDAVAVARLFVKSGVLATRAGRSVTKDVTNATAADGALAMPVVLLTSEGTANAAEIFAASLSGAKRATLVGAPTAGIAGVQKLVKLPEGHGLWLTYARYLQADGTSIHERGLRPAVGVETPVVGFDDPAPTSDPVLDRGVEELRKLAATTSAS